MIDPSSVIKAYSAAQNAAGAGATGGEAKFISNGSSFGDLVQNAISDAVQTSHNAEKQMAAQVQGKAQLVDVATALSSAQASLETVMAVRDQVITAYQEIMRMGI
ncbi:MAG: fliE [Caulobacteraceae bacterium]|jgi:flagellar hook-basal body complex protein FliE|nr:fliE [Caulobacteraceae bacterium]